MRNFLIASLAICLSACANAAQSEWPQLTATGAAFEEAWTERVLGDEYLRVGGYSADVDSWNMISLIRLPDESWLARRTELRRVGQRVTFARSTTCEPLNESIESLQQMALPTMRPLEMGREFVVVSHPPDIRLRVHTYFSDDEAPVDLTTLELRASFPSPVFWWYQGLLSGSSACWLEEGSTQ